MRRHLVALLVPLASCASPPAFDACRQVLDDQAAAWNRGDLDGFTRGYARGDKTVFAGTDAGGAVAHGRVAEEVAALHAAGLPAEVALGAASWAARRWLGRPELAEGDPADLVVYPTDPRKDLRVLAAPARVILRGRIVL